LSALNNFNNNSTANASNRNIDNNNAFVFGMALKSAQKPGDKKPRDLWQELCSIKNLELAFRKARKHKTKKLDVIDFEKNLKENLARIQVELLLHSYRPRPLNTFILRDPKTRKISKSDFRDRVVHHALCNVIAPIFEKSLIYDSYANRKGKGVIKAIARFEQYKREESGNGAVSCFVLKADVQHYFENVNHDILIRIIRERVKSKEVIWLIKAILCHYKTKEPGKGMPLGNLTSQFFANVYLNELDRYVKHTIKARHYVRYVDDFVILHRSKDMLEDLKERIDEFLKMRLSLWLHPDKSKIRMLRSGTDFLGLRVYPHHKLLKKRNIRKFRKKFDLLLFTYQSKHAGFDEIYDFLEGWVAYSRYANTYNLRKRFLSPVYAELSGYVSAKEFNRLSKKA
jgi:RNA-directed DNA polymerase